MRGHNAFITAAAATAALIAVPALYVITKTLLKSRRAQAQFTSSDFVLSAGAVSFQFVDGVPKKVLLVHYTRKNEWLLAKGRKDQGEELPAAAVREVLEETGYRCRLYPVPRLPTRAPVSASFAGTMHQPDIVRWAENSTEPFMVTIRPTDPGRVKLIFWYIGCVDVPAVSREGTTPPAPEHGSHMSAEGFDNAGLFDIEDALRMLTYAGDRDLVRTAISVLPVS